MPRSTLLTTLLTLTTAALALPATACPPSSGYSSPSRGYSSYQPAWPASQPSWRTVSRPIVRSAPAKVTTATTRSTAASREADLMATLRSKVAVAKTAFASRNYGTALERLDEVVKLAPKNNEALQFRSLVHFALGDHKKAASDAYEALKFGNAWNSTAITALYGDVARYRQHLLALRSTAVDQPEKLELRFLLAYHSLLTGDLASGESELQAVLKIRPAEPLAEKLLVGVRGARARQDQQTASNVKS